MGYSENIVINKTINFRFDTRSELPASSVLNESSTFFDDRMNLLSVDTNFNEMYWYINYIDTTAYFAKNNRRAYPTYLLDLGYVPVVYVPTCVPTLSVKLNIILDQKKIPYVKVKGTSFVRNYFSTDIVDSWVHKFDAAKLLRCNVEDVRSIPLIKEVFNIG